MTSRFANGRGNGKTYAGAVKDDNRDGFENDSELFEKLHAPLYTEVLHLAKANRNVFVKGQNWIRLIWTYTSAYISFLWTTWTRTFIAAYSGHFGDIANFFGVFIFATGASIVLWVLLIWCILAHSPVLVYAFKSYGHMTGDNRSLVNALYDMFQLTEDQAKAGKNALSQPPPDGPFSPEHPRTFDLDAAKLLLQFASLMYERTSEATHDAIRKTRASHTFWHTIKRTSSHAAFHLTHPGGLLGAVLGDPEAEKVKKEFKNNHQDGVITDFIDRWHIKYAPVSELNSVSSAFSALFWDPNSNWIVVAFKGTSPTEYDEWVSDFTYLLEEAGHQINGFSKVHRGFLQRMFPSTSESNGARKPYDTIADAVRLVSADLLTRLPGDTKVNVWFTGHSLGCATATLAYSKAIVDDEGLGLKGRVVVRDAYLFAAPICCDVPSVQAFNTRMLKHPDQPKTMWRITNRSDAVATLLPAFGDAKSSLMSPDCIFMFCHLGVEVKMESHPNKNKILGNLFDVGTPVKITSSVDEKSLSVLYKKGSGLSQAVLWWQDLPLVGRLVQHGTTFYWDQLERVGPGECVWIQQAM
ncbi:alpha/beta-hydrolase [Sistotremastrum suecicum HHB10207 ss-3]|uniref:Alpha/beta-hydrolase n=1 Tax=Sistotremastrum suecicum HHB10207 ss-3 TaxID=1314776 RepID=A0A166CJZ9_9AGAM|nr:alpha/beta-hydrolase [Sistotremastrum suecicum HHB10207 ss-3]